MTPHNLPQKWQWVKLGEICQINPKTDFDNFSDSQIVSFIPMKCVEEKTNHFTTETRTFQEVKKGYTKFQNQDILFAKITPCMENGKLCIVNNLINQKGLGSTEFHILRCNHQKVLPHFVFFFMVQDSFLKTMEYQMTGAVGQKRIKAEIIANHQIPLPPLEIQREIVEILESKLEKIKEAKASLETSLQECETYRLSLLESAFSGNLTPHSQNWQWVTLENIISTKKHSLKRGPFGSSLKKEFFVSEGIRVFEQYNPINQDSKWKRYFVSQEKYKELEAFSAKGGDLLVSCSGTLGRILELPQGTEEGIINQALLKITLDNTKILNRFFIHIFNSPTFQNLILEKTLGTAIKNIASVKELKKLPIPLPPLEIQREIVEILESKLEKIKEAKALLESSLQECETYRLSLLESAFAGELV